MYPRLSQESVRASIDISKVYSAVNRREERTVQPTSTLTDQLGNLKRVDRKLEVIERVEIRGDIPGRGHP